MTLSEYMETRVLLAGMAMQGLLSGQSNHAANITVYPVDRPAETYAENVAHDAVAHAEALMRALDITMELDT